MNKQKQGFNDPKTLLAIALTFVVFMGWQTYLSKKYPDAYKKKSAKETEQQVNQADDSKAVASATINIRRKGEKLVVDGQNTDGESETVDSSVEKLEKTFSFKNDIWSFDVSSKGMSVGNIVIYKFNKVATKPYKFANDENIYPTKINGELLDFEIVQNDKDFVGTAFYKGKKIEKIFKINTDLYTLSTELKFNKADFGDFKISHDLSSKVEDPKKAVFFLPAFDRNELFIKASDDSERKVLVSKEEMDEPRKYKNVLLTSLGDHYFSTSIINKGKISPEVSFRQNNKVLNISVDYLFSELVDVSSIEYDLFLGPKKVDLLPKISPEMPEIVNFSYLGFIARPILRGLNFFYGIFGNYGIAVIVLTFLIRLLILPLAVSSFKSMKKMQVIQPELKRIKEKYKDQPQLINQKTMAIMKDNKVNPLGGCLPMLLQLPIFFAFYRGLSESVDLYQAPFAGWITDLSKMDPYFILPVLSMAGMVIHQLVTPSTMDKAQKRMMMVMPVVFGALFVTLPSALTLYMAVSTWFGIGQHAIFLRDKKVVA